MESTFSEYTTVGMTKRYKNINTSEDCYLLGYLACDGGYVVNRKWPFMMVSSTEKYIITEFRNTYIPDSSIYNVGVKSSKKVNALNPVYELRWSPKASKQFNKYGVLCKKSARRVVGIPNKYFLQYLAGCIDADGFVSVTHRKDCRTPRLRFFITHTSEIFLADLQNRMEINTTLRQHGENVWRLQAQNTTQNMQLLNKLLPYIKNRKKYNVIKQYLNKYYVPQASDELLEG